MRKKIAKGAAAIAVATLLGAFCASPAAAESVGLIRSVVIAMLGGQVDGRAATTGQALVKQSDGSWRGGTISGSQTLAQTLAAGNTTGANNLAVANGQGIGFRAVAPGADQIKWGTGGSPSVSVPQILGPSDQQFWISSGALQFLRLYAGDGVSSGDSGGGLRADAGDGLGAGSGGSMAFNAGDGGATGGGGQASMSGGACSSGGTGASIFLLGASSAKVGGNAQLLSGSGSGTNTAGGDMQFRAALGTGTASGDCYVQTGFSLASGTTLQTAYDRVRITSKTKALSTTTATNTVFALLSNAVTDSAVGCTVTGTIELIDGTHHVGAIHFTAPFSSVNQNGTPTAGVVPVLGTSNGSITTGGTYTSLTTTFTAVVSGTNLQLGVTPTWAAGTPTTVRMTYQAQINGQGSLTPQ